MAASDTMALRTGLPVGTGAGLRGEQHWYYNKWLRRWRVEPAADEGEQLTDVGVETAAPPSGAAETVVRMAYDDSDKTLVERVKAGDGRAFEMLHRRYHARIYRFAFLRLGNAEEAADVASQTFCNALKSLHSFQFGRTSSLYPWLHRIAGNLVVDVVRGKPAGGMLSLDAQAAEDVDSFLEYLPDDGPSAQELVERSEVQELVREAIAKLPADQARAITMRFLGDLSIREIAEEMRRTEGAVKSLLHRALQGMRQHLKTAVAEARISGPVTAKRQQERAETNVPEVIHLHQRDS